MRFSVSATTRGRRQSEVNGKDYFFLTKEDFEKKIQGDELVEWERIYNDYYGTLKSEVESTLRAGDAMLFDIDVKGALSVKMKYPADAVLVFIQPPSVEALRERLEHRHTESEEVIRKRLERVPMELEKGKEFDHRIVNDNLEKAVAEVDAIIASSLEPGS
jgi:guanylate kinase